MAKALPDGGKLITLELSPKHAEVCTYMSSILDALLNTDFR